MSSTIERLVGVRLLAGLAACAAGQALADAPSGPMPKPAAARPAAAPVAPAKPAATGAAIEWVTAHDEALSRARKERKLVLLDFYTNWCGWCKRLDRDVFADAGWQKAAAGVIGVKIDAEKHPELARKYQVNSYPRLFFLSSEGVVVERIRGYLNLEQFTSKVLAVKRGDTEFARFREAASDPKNVSAVQAFARMLVESAQHDQAIPYWQQVHDSALESMFKNPHQAGAQALHRESLVELGNGYAAVGLAEVALQQFVEVLRTYPDTPEGQRAMTGLSQLRAKNPKVKLPVPLLEQLVRSNPGPIGSQAKALLEQARAGATGGAQ